MSEQQEAQIPWESEYKREKHLFSFHARPAHPTSPIPSQSIWSTSPYGSGTRSSQQTEQNCANIASHAMFHRLMPCRTDFQALFRFPPSRPLHPFLYPILPRLSSPSPPPPAYLSLFRACLSDETPSFPRCFPFPPPKPQVPYARLTLSPDLPYTIIARYAKTTFTTHWTHSKNSVAENLCGKPRTKTGRDERTSE